MSHACIALLLATTLAAPAAEPVATPTVETAPAAPVPAVAPVAPVVPAPAPALEPAPEPAPAVTLVPAPSTAVAPAPSTAVAPAPAPAPAPPRVDPEQQRALRTADGLIVGGAATLSLGGVALLLVAWPSHALYQRSLERAEQARWVTEQEPFIDDAHRRRSIMLTSAGIGAGLTVIGTVVLAMGLTRRARQRIPTAATLSLAPAVGGGHYGVGASLRF